MSYSVAERNRVANDVTASDMTVRVHTGDPGTAGTDNRIGSAEATLTAANWTDAASGVSSYAQDVSMGVLDAANNQAPTYYSLWRSTAFVGSEEFSNAVTVIAGGTHTINQSTIRVNMSNM